MKLPIDIFGRVGQGLRVRYWLKSSRSDAMLVGLVFSTLPAQVPFGTRFSDNDFTERAIFPESALSNRLCHQRATSSDSDDPDKPLFFDCYRSVMVSIRTCCNRSGPAMNSGLITAKEVGFRQQWRGAGSIPVGSIHRITDGVAARSPGKASSYLSAMKGEARRDLACHAWLQRNRGRPEPVVDPDNRESCRFHLRNRVFQSMNKTEYQAYLQSEHWQALKLKKSKLAKLCFICRQKPDRRNFHHARYKQIFDVTTNDLRLACEDCHTFYHAVKADNPRRSERWILKLVRKMKRAVTQPGTDPICL